MLDYGHTECYKFKHQHPENWESFGCGPGGVGDWLVPDTMYGLNISEACRIHDWFYRFNLDRSPVGKKLADDLMLRNCLNIVNRNSNWLTQKLRSVRCRTYYFMVSNFGQSSWDACKSVRDK